MKKDSDGVYEDLIGEEVRIEFEDRTIVARLIRIHPLGFIEVQMDDKSPPKLIPLSTTQEIIPTNGYRYDFDKLKKKKKDDDDLEWMGEEN